VWKGTSRKACASQSSVRPTTTGGCRPGLIGAAAGHYAGRRTTGNLDAQWRAGDANCLKELNQKWGPTIAWSHMTALRPSMPIARSLFAGRVVETESR